MAVTIAVYQGAEVEVMYTREPGSLQHSGNLLIAAGEVVELEPDIIHAVTGHTTDGGTSQSRAIHVYHGPLTKVQRNLFDWHSGDAVDFTMENFHAMRRNKTDMPEFKP